MTKLTIKEIEKEFVEKGADLEHDRWARWHDYFISKCDTEIDDDKAYMTLPRELFERWERQSGTKYADLSEQEKESDRKETRNYLELLNSSLQKALESVRPEERKVEYGTSEVEQQYEDRGYNQAVAELDRNIASFLKGN